MKQKALIWVDSAVPDPSKDSGSVRLFSILRILISEGHRIFFTAQKMDLTSKAVSNLQEIGVLVFESLNAIHSHAVDHNIEISSVWVSRVTVLREVKPSVKSLFKGAPVVFDTVDLHYLRLRRDAIERRSIFSLLAALRLEIIEKWHVRESDLAIAVSITELRRLRWVAPRLGVHLLSNIHEPVDELPTFEETVGLVFIGGFSHTPNTVGITWFCTEVWPHLNDAIKQAQLKIIGSNTPKEVENLAGEHIQVLGWLEDPEPTILKSRISIAPLLSGAGVKGKVGQAMALGVPVVGTQIALEGIQGAGDPVAIIANEARGFAQAINDLYFDKVAWQGIQARARGASQALFGVEQTRVNLRSITDTLGL